MDTNKDGFVTLEEIAGFHPRHRQTGFQAVASHRE
ncbi:MAG: hypothetical protein WAK36_21375 [Pseudolabrys sp.]|jgi:hypothetical protein